MWERVQQLSWADRTAYVAFIGAFWLNAWAWRSPLLTRPWRRAYGFKAGTAAAFIVCYGLYLLGALGDGRFVALVLDWLGPVLVLCLYPGASLHLAERPQLRKALETEHEIRRRLDEP